MRTNRALSAKVDSNLAITPSTTATDSGENGKKAVTQGTEKLFAPSYIGSCVDDALGRTSDAPDPVLWMVPRLRQGRWRDFQSERWGSSRTVRTRIRDSSGSDSEKLHNPFDEFVYWLLRFIAFGHLRRRPPAAGRKQPFKGLADPRIGFKMSGSQANSSVISISSRSVIAANGIAQTLEQGTQQEPLLTVGHTENPADCAQLKSHNEKIFAGLRFH